MLASLFEKQGVFATQAGLGYGINLGRKSAGLEWPEAD
jgi:hypothetical protein